MRRVSRAEAQAYIIALKRKGFIEEAKEEGRTGSLIVHLVKGQNKLKITHRPQGWFKVESI